MITAEQTRGARAMLGWTMTELAKRAGLNWFTIQRMESQSGIPAVKAPTMAAIIAAFESAGVVFLADDGSGPGVRLKPKKQRR